MKVRAYTQKEMQRKMFELAKMLADNFDELKQLALENKE